MRPLNCAILANISVAFASEAVFSVHDDVLAYPQYEVIFSNSFISDTDAETIIAQSSSNPDSTSNSKAIESHIASNHLPHLQHDRPFDPSRETYELMKLNGETNLCTIPIVEKPARNESSEAEARAAEQKELARATGRGWELLQDLEGNCLYYVSGWWSYSFCYNDAIVQFHQVQPLPGQPLLPPVRDPNTKEFVLGKAKPRSAPKESTEDEWGNQIEVRKGRKKTQDPPKTELQIKGDTRYLVQTMEGGTTCDLTGKPRKVEVQFHCNPQVNDRIGYIKEVQICSYLMVIYTPRLCHDVAFLPPKEAKANAIICRVVVPSADLAFRNELRLLEDKLAAPSNQKAAAIPINVGGIIIGAGKYVNKEGQRMPVPPNFGSEPLGRAKEVIARAKSKADGGQVEIASNSQLEKLDLDPQMVENLKKEIQEMAKEKGWKIEVIDAPGERREIIGTVEGDGKDEDEDGEGEGEGDGDEKGQSKNDEGSEEIFKDEL